MISPEPRYTECGLKLMMVSSYFHCLVMGIGRGIAIAFDVRMSAIPRTIFVAILSSFIVFYIFVVRIYFIF